MSAPLVMGRVRLQIRLGKKRRCDSFNPLGEQGIPLEDQLRNWSELNVEPIECPRSAVRRRGLRRAGPSARTSQEQEVVLVLPRPICGLEAFSAFV